MTYTINSRKLNKEVTFSIPGTYYIYVDLNGRSGTLGDQICAGGELLGLTIGYGGSDPRTFEKICKAWFKKYLKNI